MSSRAVRSGLVIAALCVLLALPACREDEPPAQTTPIQEDDKALAQEIDRLRSLGYAGASEEAAEPALNGLTRLDENRWSPGYTLFNSRNYCVAELIGLAGEVVHTWEQPKGRAWDDCMLLADGHLLVVGADRVTTPDAPIDDEARFVMRLTWDSEVVWKRTMFAHHDLDVLPNQELIVVTHKYERIPELKKGRETVVDYLTLMSVDGKVKEEKSLYDAFTSNPDVFAFNAVGAVTAGATKRWDPFHANAVERMHHEHLFDHDPIYAAGNVLVCVRHQDAIAIIDWDTNKLVWAWGPGEIQGPHDAQVLANGNILLFDNGLWRKWSRVIELDPLTKEIVWEFRTAPQEDFYTHSGGGCQRLPNGNTLITNSDNGFAFEVTPAGDIVWEYHNPKVTLEGKRLSITRMRRYAPAFVEAILTEKR